MILKSNFPSDRVKGKEVGGKEGHIEGKQNPELVYKITTHSWKLKILLGKQQSNSNYGLGIWKEYG